MWYVIFAKYYLSLILLSLLESMGTALRDAPGLPNGKYREMPLLPRFTIVRKRLSQSEALYYCENRGKGDGRLAVLITLDEAQQLSKALKNVSTPFSKDPYYQNVEFHLGRRYWIGLTDMAVEGQWYWHSGGGKLTYDFWGLDKQPDHHFLRNTTINPFEHCVTFWNPGYSQNEEHTFNDEFCLNEYYFICEDPPFSIKES